MYVKFTVHNKNRYKETKRFTVVQAELYKKRKLWSYGLADTRKITPWLQPKDQWEGVHSSNNYKRDTSEKQISTNLSSCDKRQWAHSPYQGWLLSVTYYYPEYEFPSSAEPEAEYGYNWAGPCDPSEHPPWGSVPVTQQSCLVAECQQSCCWLLGVHLVDSRRWLVQTSSFFKLVLELILFFRQKSSNWHSWAILSLRFVSYPYHYVMSLFTTPAYEYNLYISESIYKPESIITQESM